MRTGRTNRSHGAGDQHCNRGEAEHGERQAQDGEYGHLDLLGLDLLAEIFGCAANHQAGDEDGDDDEHQDAVETCADAADDDFAELHVDERDHAAKCRERAVHGIDCAAGGSRGDDGEERRQDDAEADFLAFHVAAVDAECMDKRVAGSFCPVGDDDAGHK